jgi:hypothetical protein
LWALAAVAVWSNDPGLPQHAPYHIDGHRRSSYE